MTWYRSRPSHVTPCEPTVVMVQYQPKNLNDSDTEWKFYAFCRLCNIGSISWIVTYPVKLLKIPGFMRLTIRLQSFLDEVRISRASGLERIFSKSALAFRLISSFIFVVQLVAVRLSLIMTASPMVRISVIPIHPNYWTQNFRYILTVIVNNLTG